MPENRLLRKAPRRLGVLAIPSEAARAAVRGFGRGDSVVGMTKGQFSLLDLIRAVQEVTGPCHLTVSTWTAGIRDVENVGLLHAEGRFLSLSLLVDRSFPGRAPQYCDEVRRVFGEDAIRLTRTHAKFALLRNAEWDVAIRSSMNLNRNPRFEQFDVDDSREVCALFAGLVDEMCERVPPGLSAPESQIERGFALALGDERTDAQRAAAPVPPRDAERLAIERLAESL